MAIAISYDGDGDGSSGMMTEMKMAMETVLVRLGMGMERNCPYESLRKMSPLFLKGDGLRQLSKISRSLFFPG